MKDVILVYCTCKDLDEARRIAEICVENRLAACANLLPTMHSIYWWDSKLEESNEVVLLFKTKTELFSSLKDKILALHSYKVPCIISLPILDGNSSYLDWISSETL